MVHDFGDVFVGRVPDCAKIAVSRGLPREASVRVFRVHHRELMHYRYSCSDGFQAKEHQRKGGGRRGRREEGAVAVVAAVRAR